MFRWQNGHQIETHLPPLSHLITSNIHELFNLISSQFDWKCLRFFATREEFLSGEMKSRSFMDSFGVVEILWQYRPLDFRDSFGFRRNFYISDFNVFLEGYLEILINSFRTEEFLWIIKKMPLLSFRISTGFLTFCLIRSYNFTKSKKNLV